MAGDKRQQTTSVHRRPQCFGSCTTATFYVRISNFEFQLSDPTTRQRRSSSRNVAAYLPYSCTVHCILRKCQNAHSAQIQSPITLKYAVLHCSLSVFGFLRVGGPSGDDACLLTTNDGGDTNDDTTTPRHHDTTTTTTQRTVTTANVKLPFTVLALRPLPHSLSVLLSQRQLLPHRRRLVTFQSEDRHTDTQTRSANDIDVSGAQCLESNTTSRLLADADASADFVHACN